MNLKLLLRIIRSRIALVIFVLAGTLAVTTFVTLNTPKRYSTYTSVVLDLQASGPFDQAGIPRQLTSDYLMTQVDIIRSRNVAYKVLDRLEYSEVATIARDYLTAADFEQTILDDPRTRNWLASILLENLEVTPPRDSRVLDIWFTSPDPELSAVVADAFAQAYIDASLELNVEPARRNAAWFDEQLTALRGRLEAQQRALTAFQENNDIVAVDERLDTEMRRFEELASSLVETQSATFDVRSRQLGVEHPEYKRAMERERSIQQALDRQKVKVFEVRRQRDQLDLLLQDVESARKTYDLALQEYSRNLMEGQFNQTNIAVLNKAAASYVPSSPNFRTNLGLAALLGLVFGLGLALAVEALSRRVRIEDDLSDGVGVPVLVSL